MKIFCAMFLLWFEISLRAGDLSSVQTVFVIVLENHDWSDFKGSSSAPFLNQTLLPNASYCEAYFNPPGLHPSEPNYLWLEAGTNFGILSNYDPVINHQNTTNHLTAQLRAANISWKTYQEDIGGDVVPLVSTNGYAPKHNPFVFFDDLTSTNNLNDFSGIAHNRPLPELFTDLTNNTMARYNFITPNLCNDGHDSCAPQYDPVKQSDDWLASIVPSILASAAYSNNGALFITWDESLTGDNSIGMILLSPLARGGSYFNNIYYTPSSFLRTMQEIFGVSPWLGDAVNATDLSDLFIPYAVSILQNNLNGSFQINVSGAILGGTNVLQISTNFVSWQNVVTNVVTNSSFAFTNIFLPNSKAAFYRSVKLP